MNRGRTLWTTLLIAGATVLGASVARADNGVGKWGPLGAWPLVALHSVLTVDGRVLSYGTTTAGQQTGMFVYDVWNPAQGITAGHTTLPNSTGVDLFCSSPIVVPQTGDIFIAGGDHWDGSKTLNIGNDDSTLFRPANNTLSRGPHINRTRWYASQNVLPNGEISIIGGAGGGDHPEVRTITGDMRFLTTADTELLDWWYPRTFLAPDGRVFGIADRDLFYFDTAGTGMVSRLGRLTGGSSGNTSSEVMFAPGRILHAGGGALQVVDVPATAAAEVVDINGPVPVVTATNPMPLALHYHQATIVPDGKVIVTGGGPRNNLLEDFNTRALIWNPWSGAWTVGAATTSGKARLYHSTALLLPDATILVAGGGAAAYAPQTNLNAEIYYPPYLFDRQGNPLPRPVVTAAPATIAPGQPFAVSVSSARGIAKITLIRTGAVTHSANFDQRYLQLTFSQTSPTSFLATPPQRGSTLPPGRYMLFVVDTAGAPSVARLVSVGVAADPKLAVDWTPTIGSALSPGTADWRTTCTWGQVMVGVFGEVAGAVTKIGPRCVSLTAGGLWQGTPRNGTPAGTGAGTPFAFDCPVNHAVSGLKGSVATRLDQLTLACRPIGADLRLTGAAVEIPSIGTATGTAFGPYHCGTANPGKGLYGRLDGSAPLHSAGVLCGPPASWPPIRVTVF